MTELFRRDWRVRVDTLELVGLDCSWDITKTRKREPNACSLRVYNLTEDQRKHLSGLSLKPAKSGAQVGRIRVEIEAGYASTGRTLRFRGDLRTCVSEPDGADWVTTIEGEDGGRAVLLGRIAKTFSPGTTYAAAVRECARAMGVGVGNLNEVVGASTQTFARGAYCHGPASVVLQRLMRALGVTYSVQNGVLQFHARGQALRTQAVLLTAATGLVGAPQRDVSGVVTVRSLLIGDIVPGGRVQLGEGEFRGLYSAERTKETCATYAQDWYVDAELKP